MKNLLLAFTLLLPPIADAAPYCTHAPASQKLVWNNFRSFLRDKTDASADFYLGSLKLYMVAVTSTNYEWPALEVGPLASLEDPATSCLGAEINEFNARLARGDRAAIRLVVLYSTLDIADGAFGEALADTQMDISKKFPRPLALVKAQNASYLRAHPIERWGN